MIFQPSIEPVQDAMALWKQSELRKPWPELYWHYI